MMRFGVLGAGRIGKVHARTIAASGKAKVAYLADALPKAAADLAAEVGAKVASVEDIIKAKDVDAILIATPTPFHAEQIEAGSNAGKPVLCEKPVSLSVERIAQCLKVVTRPGCLAIARYAFEMARSMGRRRLTCVHKANIHKMSDGLFLDSFREVAEEYPELMADDILIDNACMQLVSRPEQFDVMVLPNLYGDIVSDLCAGLVGGLGVAPGGNIGVDRAVFEAVHGSAPDIAGRGLANPTAMLLSSTLMLYYLGFAESARRIETALRTVLGAGIKTRDLGGTASTKEYTAAIIEALPEIELGQTNAFAPARGPFAHRGQEREPGEWSLYGVDVFVHSQGLPKPPQRVGPLELSLISNRGTKVYPGPTPEIFLVDWFRLRYRSSQPVTDADIYPLLTEISRQYDWMHIEKLHQSGSTAMFSKAQGE